MTPKLRHRYIFHATLSFAWLRIFFQSVIKFSSRFISKNKPNKSGWWNKINYKILNNIHKLYIFTGIHAIIKRNMMHDYTDDIYFDFSPKGTSFFSGEKKNSPCVSTNPPSLFSIFINTVSFKMLYASLYAYTQRNLSEIF